MSKAKRAPKTGVQENRTIVKAEFRALEDSSDQYELSFSSEQPVYRWFGQEILMHDAGAVDLARMQTVGTVLFSHGRDANYGKVPIARVDETWLDTTERRLKAKITFDPDEDSQLIKQKVESGSIRGVSFGYSVDSWEEVLPGKTSSNGRFTGPAYIGLKWTPYEISIEPIPADPSVGVGRELEDENIERDEEDMKRRNQQFFAADTGAGEGGAGTPPPITGEKTITPPAPAPVDLKAERQAAITAERQRVSDITALCRDFSMDPSAHITSGATVDDVRAAVLEELKKTNAPVGGVRAGDGVVKAEEDKIRAAATDAILLRGGINVEKVADGAREFRALSLRDLAIDCLVRSGYSQPHRLDNDDLLREALTPDSQFTSILSNSANKSMATAYNAVNTTYQVWTRKGSNSDFKPATHYQISEAGELKQMTQGGEFQFDEMKDQGVTKSLATFGRSFGFTRQAMINDDLSVLTTIPAAYARSSRRGINKLVYQMVGLNPAISDGTALFHANHKNLGQSGVISVTTVGEGRKLMKQQKNLRGLETLNVGPRWLLVPTEKETDAEKFLNSVSDPGQNNPNVVNPFSNKLQLISDAELDSYSTTAWYLIADPGDIDTIEVTYLNGNDMPILESQMSFKYLGIEWRIYMDYGVTILDYKGMMKNAGA